MWLNWNCNACRGKWNKTACKTWITMSLKLRAYDFHFDGKTYHLVTLNWLVWFVAYSTIVNRFIWTSDNQCSTSTTYHLLWPTSISIRESRLHNVTFQAPHFISQHIIYSRPFNISCVHINRIGWIRLFPVACIIYS